MTTKTWCSGKKMDVFTVCFYVSSRGWEICRLQGKSNWIIFSFYVSFCQRKQHFFRPKNEFSLKMFKTIKKFISSSFTSSISLTTTTTTTTSMDNLNQDENRRLLDRLMHYKAKDADKLNEENESFIR